MVIKLYWRASASQETRFTVFTQLLGPDGQLYGQHDSPPGYGTLSTDRWQPGQLIPDEHRFFVADNARPGDYQLLIGFYNPLTGERVPRTDGAGDYASFPLHIGE